MRTTAQLRGTDLLLRFSGSLVTKRNVPKLISKSSSPPQPRPAQNHPAYTQCDTRRQTRRRRGSRSSRLVSTRHVTLRSRFMNSSRDKFWLYFCCLGKLSLESCRTRHSLVGSVRSRNRLGRAAWASHVAPLGFSKPLYKNTLWAPQHTGNQSRVCHTSFLAPPP